MNKVLYRYEIEYKSYDGDTSIWLKEIPVVRETDKSYFVQRFYFGGSERRISKSAYNTYAYDTKEAAKKHFIRRTSTRISWYEYWTKECKKALELIEDEQS